MNADAGLPIPDTTLRIDLALTNGVPAAAQTLKVVLDEMIAFYKTIRPMNVSSSLEQWADIDPICKAASFQVLGDRLFDLFHGGDPFQFIDDGGLPTLVQSPEKHLRIGGNIVSFCLSKKRPEGLS